MENNSSIDEDPSVNNVSVNDIETTFIAITLSLMILCMIFGNILVITAIIIEKDLQRSQYFLILSLAVTDLFVGVMVSPLAALYEIHKQWHLGYVMCDLWTSLDVLVCTSSILHLVAIALDRYWSITDVAYSQKRTPQRIGIMILVVWIVSLVTSIAPLFGWKDDDFEIRVEKNHCLISQDIVYQIFSTTTAFYAPLVIICVLYYKIFKAAQHRIRLQQQRRSSTAISANNRVVILRKSNLFSSRSIRKQKLSLPAFPLSQPSPGCLSSEERAKGRSIDFSWVKDLSFKRKSTTDETSTYNPENSVEDGTDTPKSSMCTPLVTPKTSVALSKSSIALSDRGSVVLGSDIKKCAARKRESVESKRERRAGRTLAIITSIFVMCWVPFFILALYRPICSAYRGAEHCQVNHALESSLGWLGYMNSALNPILYTIFSPDFRNAFKKIVQRIFSSMLCCTGKRMTRV